LDNILDKDTEKVKEHIKNLTKTLKREIDFYEFYMDMGMSESSYIKVIAVSSKKALKL